MHTVAANLVERAHADHRAALVRHLASVTRDAEAGEDLAQEAFLRQMHVAQLAGA